jgi:hypothetical protein
VELVNGNVPFGALETTNILSFGDMGTNMVTGKLETLPITDPDSLKPMPNGSLLLTGEADSAYIFINHPGTAQQTASFVDLPKGDVADDAIMPTSSSGMFFISNQGANDVVQVQVTGLNTHDLYADITNKNELVQIDPTTGKVTTLLAGLSSPHGLLFQPAANTPTATPSLHDLVAGLPDLHQSLVGSVLPTVASTFGGAVSDVQSSGALMSLITANHVPITVHHVSDQLHA